VKQNILKFLTIFFFALAVYSFFAPGSYQPRHYFVPLASSILHGRLDIAPNGDTLNELVCRSNKCFVVYPPAPALAAILFVLIFGAGINQVIPSVVYAALAVAIFYFLTREFFKQRWIQISLTLLFGFGTNFFYTSLSGSAWYFSHIMVVLFSVLALFFAVRKKPVLAGLMLVGAFWSRLPAIFLFPALLYLVLRERKRGERLKPFLKLLLPVVGGIVIIALYNYYRFGSFLQSGYSLIPGVLEEVWYERGIFDLTYIPRNLEVIFASMPKFLSSFPYLNFSNFGTAMWVVTPALLLLIVTKLKDKLAIVFLMSALLIAIPSLLHGAPGFSQFGYRFSLDYIVLLIVALGFVFRRLGPKISLPLVGLSVAINFWAVLLFYLGRFGT